MLLDKKGLFKPSFVACCLLQFTVNTGGRQVLHVQQCAHLESFALGPWASVFACQAKQEEKRSAKAKAKAKAKGPAHLTKY